MGDLEKFYEELKETENLVGQIRAQLEQVLFKRSEIIGVIRYLEGLDRGTQSEKAEEV